MDSQSRDSLIKEIIEIIDISLNIINRVKEIKKDTNKKVKIQTKIVITMAEVTKSLNIAQNDLLYKKSNNTNIKHKVNARYYKILANQIRLVISVLTYF